MEPEGGQRGRPLLVAVAIALLLLLLQLAWLDDVGPSWDLVRAESSYGESILDYLRTGHEPMLAPALFAPRLYLRAPHPDFRVERAPSYASYPLAATLSAASCWLLWTEAGWMRAMAAHHVPVLLFTAAMIVMLVLFAARHLGPSGTFVGAAAALLLASSPQFLAHGTFNLKDAPEACLYVGGYLAAWSALRRPRSLARWALVGLLLGAALAQKANALMLPVQVGVLALLLARPWRAPAARLGFGDGAGPDTSPDLRAVLRGGLLALLVAALAWAALCPPFWVHGWPWLAEHVAWIARMGTTETRGDLFDGFESAVATTPLSVLLLALVGACATGLDRPRRRLLVVGALFPVARTLLPQARVHDGVRLFLEFYPCLCLLAGVGLAEILDRWRAPRVARALLLALVVLPGARAAVDTWPFGHTFHNVLVGGLAGAREARVSGAGDNWGLSFWQGLDWLAQHAPLDSSVLAPVGEHVVRAAAPVRLRPDLNLIPSEGGRMPYGALYVLELVRPGAHEHWIGAVRAEGELVHAIEVQGAPLLRIWRVGDARVAQRLVALWREQQRSSGDRQARLLALLGEGEPERIAALIEALRSEGEGAEKLFAELRAELPETWHKDLDALAATVRANIRPP